MISAANKRKFIQLLAIVIIWPLFLVVLDMSLKEENPRPLPLAEAGFAPQEMKKLVSRMANP